jgi:uncharacterized membrane protein
VSEPGLPEQREVPPDLERVIFFSDAVFAIAMTLLVIDLTIPTVGEMTNQQLLDELSQLGPSLFSYALSFGVVGMYWLAHWRRFHYIERANEQLALINLVLLGFVALIPFPTAVLAAHGDLPASLLLYVAVLATGGIIGALSWLYAYRAGLCRPDVGQRELALGLMRSLSGPVVMIASLPFIFLNFTTLAEAFWLLIFPLQIVLRRIS